MEDDAEMGGAVMDDDVPGNRSPPAFAKGGSTRPTDMTMSDANESDSMITVSAPKIDGSCGLNNGCNGQG